MSSLSDQLLSIISPDVLSKRNSYKSQSTRCYAIRSEVDVLLDVGTIFASICVYNIQIIARKTLNETANDIYDYSEGLSSMKWIWILPSCLSLESVEIPLKLKYFPDKGFVFQVIKSKPMSGIELKVSESLISLSESKTVWMYTTVELLKLNARIRESLEEIFLITDKCLQCIWVGSNLLRLLETQLASLREHNHLFYGLSEIIGILDYICSAAEYYQQHQSGTILQLDII